DSGNRRAVVLGVERCHRSDASDDCCGPSESSSRHLTSSENIRVGIGRALWLTTETLSVRLDPEKRRSLRPSVLSRQSENRCSRPFLPSIIHGTQGRTYHSYDRLLIPHFPNWSCYS